MTLVLSWQPLRRLLADGLDDLAVHHWREVAGHHDLIPRDPDYDQFQKVEDLGMLRCLGAWRDDRLIGYSCFIVAPHLHYRSSLHALNDVIFVLPDERGIGVRLIRKAERDLFAEGVVRIIYHVKTQVRVGRGGRHTVGDILAALGYNKFEENFSRTVDDHGHHPRHHRGRRDGGVGGQ